MMSDICRPSEASTSTDDTASRSPDSIPPSPPRTAASALLFQEWTFAFRQRPKRFVTGNCFDNFHEIPWIFRFRRRLDLHEIHIVHHPTVFADITARCKDIVHRSGSHFRQNGKRFVGAKILYGLQIMGHRPKGFGLYL